MTSKHVDSGFGQRPDRRISELGSVLQGLNPLGKATYGFVSNPMMTADLEASALGKGFWMALGKITQALPYVNWYKVQVDGTRGVMGACALSGSGLMPMGVSDSGVLPVNSWTIVCGFPGLSYGIILGTVPHVQTDNTLAMSDWVSQGSNVGFKHEPAHYHLLSMLKKGGVKDFSCNRPIDALSCGEKSFMAETGVGLHIDSFQAFLRVNEICGLFLNYYDSYARLAAWNFDLQTAGHEICARNDEGELQYFHGDATYPWEAVGYYDTGKFSKSYTDVEAQYDKPFSVSEPSDEDLQSFYRFREWGGYLGQGRKRTIVLPPVEGDRQQYGSGDPGAEMGVFDESIGLDGSYQLQSARGISFVKRAVIAVPKQIRLPEDQREDSDSAANYMASGKTGTGTEHKVGDPAYSNDPASVEDKSLRSVVGIQELLAHACNWRGVHPFHYHKKDYQLPQSSEAGSPDELKLHTEISFDRLINKGFIDPPDPKTRRVDHRDNADYYETQSYITMLPEGGIVLGDGYGSEIKLTGGHVYITTPGDIIMQSGRTTQVWGGDDVVIKARNSVDVTASKHDVRVKAEGNMQLLAGNGERGGVLIESKAAGVYHEYDGKIGEEVISSGVLLRAKNAQVVTQAQEVYLRTTSGPVVLDADKGKADIRVNARNIDRHISGTMYDYFGQNGNTTAANEWSEGSTLLHTGLVLKGTLVVADGSVISDFGYTAANGHYTSPEGGEVGTLQGPALRMAQQATARASERGQELVEQGTTDYEENLELKFYGTAHIGGDQLIEKATFSLRDDQDSKQYGARGYALPECRWQQMVRFEQGSGGSIWEETAVTYQGRKQYPYPGAKYLKDDDSFLQLSEQKLSGKMHDASREDQDYGNTSLPDLEKKSILETYLSNPQDD